MLSIKNLSLIAMLAVGAAAAPGLASADHDRGYGRDFRRDATWMQIGHVGTHTHDAEDYVPVANLRLDSLQLRAQGNPVAIDGVTIQFADGRTEFTSVRKRLRPGEAIMIDLPESRAPIKMLVLDYGNRGPHWRARETASVQVLGLADRDFGRRDQDRFRDGYDRNRDRDTYRDSYRDSYRDTNRDRYEWRAGFQVRVQ